MLYKVVLVSAVQCKSAVSLGMYASPPSQTSLQSPCPSRPPFMCCTGPIISRVFWAIFQSLPTFFALPSLASPTILFKSENDLHARCRVYLPGFPLTCIWSREHSLFIKILGPCHVSPLGHSASHSPTHTGLSRLSRYPQVPHLCMAKPSLFPGTISLTVISWERPPLHFLYVSLHHPAPHPLCLLTDFSPPGIFS